MKKVYFAIILLFFFLQSSFVPAVAGGWFGLNLLLAAVVSLSLLFDFEENIIWIFLAGILFESFSSSFFGIGMISFLAAAFFVFLFKRVFLAEEKQLFIGFLVIALAKIFFDGTFLALSAFFDIVSQTPVHFWQGLSLGGYLWEMFWFVLMAGLVHWIMAGIKDRFNYKFKEIKV
ncbi:MAG: hypothetical protein U5L10_01775 [Candidatus Moranbacteria bacterium]|nr:hypothetical protein [Candidatus Moranbacteria bacterium]